jgi:hypothetical protein
MNILASQCAFNPDTSSPETFGVGDGELIIEASTMGLEPGVSPPNTICVEYADTGHVREFALCGREFVRRRGDQEFVGWTYWDDESPCINLKVLDT